MTPTQIQAVEMAIEALNSCRIMSVASTPAKEVTPKKITKAIEALRAALAEQADDKADAERLDALDRLCESYGFQDIHEGNRWTIEGPFRNVREAIDAARSKT